MKQKKVTFNNEIKVKEFRKNEPVCANKILEYKNFIKISCISRIIIIFSVIIFNKVSFYDKLWANTTIITSSLIIYFIINYNYAMLWWLHALWVPILTFWSVFLINKYLILEALWFNIGVQFAWAVFGSCILFEENEGWYNNGFSNLASLLAIIWTVILTHNVSK